MDADVQYYVNKENNYEKVDDKISKDAVRYKITGVGTNTSGITLQCAGKSSGKRITITTNGTGNHS